MISPTASSAQTEAERALAQGKAPLPAPSLPAHALLVVPVIPLADRAERSGQNHRQEPRPLPRALCPLANKMETDP